MIEAKNRIFMTAAAILDAILFETNPKHNMYIIFKTFKNLNDKIKYVVFHLEVQKGILISRLAAIWVPSSTEMLNAKSGIKRILNLISTDISLIFT